MAAVILPVLTLLACSNHGSGKPSGFKRELPVTIEIEVYDPDTNSVWVDVGVRLVQAQQEWSGCVCSNPDREAWYDTDEFGIAFFAAEDVAAAEIGFQVDAEGQAVISSRKDEDEAMVLVEVWAKGFDPVFWEIPITYKNNEPFVSIPFVEPKARD